MIGYCHSCGNKAEEIAKFCGGCGVELNVIAQGKTAFTTDQDSKINLIPENIRLNLKKYEKHLSRTCLECGYVGLMGVSRVVENKKNNWILWIVGVLVGVYGFLFGITFITALAVGAIAGAFIFLKDQKETKTYVVCPSCSIECI
jgi:hypothetical protein